jgi:hypothetical protein
MFVRSRIVKSAPLTDDALRTAAPAVFADAPHASRTDRYRFIPTIEVVNGLRDAGFLPVLATQAKPKDEDRQGHAKHMIRFRRSDVSVVNVGDTFPELVLINSHDGSSGYQLSAGLFRLACSNGLIVADTQFGTVRVWHMGDQIKQVVSRSHDVLEGAVKAMEVSRQWGQRLLTSNEASAFASAAHHVRFADPRGLVDTPITPDQLLRPRRAGDTGNDLWTTFNRVQENVIRGGLQAWDVRDGKRRRVSTREVKGIDGNVNLNKALWILAERLAAAPNN